MGWNHQLDKHWRYSYFWLGGVVLMGRWFDMSTYFHVKDPRSKCWWQLRASMCLDTSNMFGTSAILISLNLLRWEFSNFGWISTLMKLKKRAAEEVMMIREWPTSYLKNIWKLGVFSAYLDLFSWWFFMDWDHMGFITIWDRLPPALRNSPPAMRNSEFRCFYSKCMCTLLGITYDILHFSSTRVRGFL